MRWQTSKKHHSWENTTPRKASDLLSQCGGSSPAKPGRCANTSPCPWISRLLITRSNSSSHDSLPQNFQAGLKTYSGERCKREILILTAQQWQFVTEEWSGMEGKDAQLQEGVKLSGSRNARDRTDSFQGSEVSLGDEIRNSFSIVL